MWALIPESVLTTQVSGLRSSGDSGCAQSQPPLGRDTQKSRKAPDRSGTPLLYLIESLDYSILRSAPIFVADVTGGAILI